MFDHVSVGVSDVAKAKAFYDAAFEPLGFKAVFEFGDHAIAYGEKLPTFWVQKPFDGNSSSAGNGSHFCFRARSRQAVRDFYDAAIAQGGTDAGKPGLRPEYTPTYYGAFVYDLDGNKLEAVCHEADES